MYEAQPRFTLDTSTQTRRSLAVRFRKSLTQVLSTRQAITVHPFANLENHTGAFITGQSPCWILSSDAHPVRSYALKQAAMAFGRTTHLGNMGDYFIRIEDVSAIPDLLTSGNVHLLLPPKAQYRVFHALRPVPHAEAIHQHHVRSVFIPLRCRRHHDCQVSVVR